MNAADQGRASTREGQGTRDPEEIREEIEETRGELGETVSEVAAKTDVKAQAQAKTDELKEQAGAKAQVVKAKAQENPLPLAVGGAFLAGIVLGRLTSR